MRGPRFGNWLDRPGYVALVAFVAGAAVAGIIVAIVLVRGGGNDESTQAQTTPTIPSTGEAMTPATTGTVAAATGTPTPGRFTTPRDALAAFVQERFGQTYLGPCPPSVTGQTPAGICSTLLYESDQLATYFVGPPLSEGIGEAVLTVGADGTWSLDFVSAEGFSEGLAVGGEAVVYGAGDCLRFHTEANTGAETLSCQLDGTRARVMEGPVQSGGITWWRLEGYGWASAEFLMATAR